MEASKESKNVTLNLSDDEALVLFEWLSRFNEEQPTIIFKDQAEQRILYNLEATLEKILVAPFDADYMSILARAWDRIRDKD